MMVDEINKETMIFTFEGDNRIDINLLIKTLEGISVSYTNTIKAIEPNASIKLEVEAFEQGSFEVIIGSLIENIPPMFKYIQTVIPGIKTFMEILKIKKELKGEKPKEIINEQGKTAIVNHQGETHYHDSNITNIYINNPIIDKSMAEAFAQLCTSNSRKAVNLSTGNETLKISSEEYPAMSKNIIDDTIEIDKVQNIESVVNTELLLRKPDLMCESMWVFQYEGKSISATIEDQEFLNGVKIGEIKTLYAQVRLPVRMKIEVTMNEKLEPIHKRYTIIEITGDIIEPENYEQTKF